MDPLRVAIIGCGDITRSHLWGYWSMAQCGQPDFRIVALCSRNREHSEQYIGRHLGGPPGREHAADASPRERRYKSGPIGTGDLPQGNARVDWHADWKEVVARDDVDVVEIHLPPAMHHFVAEAALRAGKHVVVEKPVALTMRGARRVVEASRDSGRRVAVGLNLRFDGVVRAAEWMVQSGRLGGVRMFISMTPRGPGHWQRPVGSKVTAALHRVRDVLNFHRPSVLDRPLGARWRYFLASASAGELIENGIHLLDLGRKLAGEIDRATGVLARLQPLEIPGPDGAPVACEVPDTFQSLLRFRSGAIGLVGVSSGVWGETAIARENFKLYGDEGCVTQEEFVGRDGKPHDSWELFRSEAPRALQERWFPGGLTHRFGLHKLDLLTAIRAGRAPEIDADEGARSLAACYAIAEADRLGREVSLDEALSGAVSGYQDPIDVALGLLAPEAAALAQPRTAT